MKYLILFLTIITFSCSFNAQEFNHIYQKVKSIPKQTYKSINQVHDLLVKSNYSQEEKTQAFAKFIVNNVAYGKRAKTPLKCVNSGEGVCQDYSELFKALCDISNIECQVVVGSGKNDSQDIGFYSSNHAWNAVKVNGKFQLFDLTWAAGGVSSSNIFTKKFNPLYFNTEPSVFVLNHFPDDQNWQLLENPISKNSYINSPIYDREFKNLSLKKGVVKKNNFEITFDSEQDFDECTLFKRRLNIYGTIGGIDLPFKKTGNKYSVVISETNPGAYSYNVSFKNSSLLEIESVTNDKDGSISTIYKPYSSPSINFVLVTQGFKVSKPMSYDKHDRWGLIEAYHYIFQNLDLNFFRQINKSFIVKNLTDLKNVNLLHQSLKDWYGQYQRFFVNMSNGVIYYPVNNFKIILTNTSNGYEFKEIKKSNLKIGDMGYLVAEVQKVLGLNQTGYFDAQTDIKVKSFQKINNLKPDGIIGEGTYTKLGL